jgi:hypothetical protein
MSIVKAVFSRMPVTSVVILSGIGFLASSLIPSRGWALVIFYMFAVPYYLVALLATAIAIELQLGLQALWVALALVLLADAALMATRWAADRTLRGSRP